MKKNWFRFSSAVWLSVATCAAMVIWLYGPSHGHTQATVRALGLCVVVLMATTMLLARALYKLRKPMHIAVSIADRIAEGKPVRDEEFDAKSGVGNLLPALGRMYMSMQVYRFDAAEKRKGFEEKISQLAHSQSSLAEAQRLARMGNWDWGTRECEARWSDEMYRVLGMEPGACPPLWASFLELVDTSDREKLQQEFRKLLRWPGTLSMEHYINLPDGMYRCIHNHISSRAGTDGRIVHLHGTIQDITERKQVEDKLHFLAMYDNLTGLPNRRLFHEQLALSIARSKRANGHLAVMFIDLDRFKRINDTLGHATGDLLLKEVSARLGNCVRTTDTLARSGINDAHPSNSANTNSVARLGGDEFTVTLDELARPQDAARVSRRILSELARPFMLDGQEVVVTCSIGIAVCPGDGDQAEILLQHADVAMYQAKEQGKNNYQFFAGAMNSAAVEKLKLEAALRVALERNEFVLHYQPKIDVISGRITGVEALLRWQHPEWGMVMPGTFIPVAEEIGLIVRMGEWVLEEACRQLKAWRYAGLCEIDMAINLASPSFRQADLVSRVAGTLRLFNVEPARLCLEATESILMRDADATMATLRALRDIGVKLSVDDFGTGYSSLSYLRRFPIDQVKIDRSFVKDITVSSDDAAIVAAIVSLARTLKLEIVAEGVETAEQARTLTAQGCRYMQGYLFSKPAPATEITRMLADGGRLSGLALYAVQNARKPALVA